jgi:hypothetical protein
VQDTTQMHQKDSSLLDVLKMMPIEYGHRFSSKDLSIIKDKIKEFQFYKNVLSFDGVPVQFSDFINIERENSLYNLSNIFDKYTLEDSDLKKTIIHFEALSKEINFRT